MNTQGQAEYRAGYLSGLRGDPKPTREQGRAFHHGWVNGMADREAACAT